jgi:hypothetical protein
MKVTLTVLLTAFAMALGASFVNAGASLPDSDSDGVPDEWDNCSTVANPSQGDPDLDGFGVACDCDYDNNGACDGLDFTAFTGGFGSTVPPADPNLDFDENGAVDGLDFSNFAAGFGGFPGPSGLPCAGSAPCVGI